MSDKSEQNKTEMHHHRISFLLIDSWRWMIHGGLLNLCVLEAEHLRVGSMWRVCDVRHPVPTWSPHADLLQVFSLHIVEVRESSDVKLVPDSQEILLQLHVCEQLREPLCPLVCLHVCATHHTHTRYWCLITQIQNTLDEPSCFKQYK